MKAKSNFPWTDKWTKGHNYRRDGSGILERERHTHTHTHTQVDRQKTKRGGGGGGGGK